MSGPYNVGIASIVVWQADADVQSVGFYVAIAAMLGALKMLDRWLPTTVRTPEASKMVEAIHGNTASVLKAMQANTDAVKAQNRTLETIATSTKELIDTHRGINPEGHPMTDDEKSKLDWFCQARPDAVKQYMSELLKAIKGEDRERY